MSYSTVNRVVLIGNLTRDPELRALATGDSVCSLRIACNGRRSDGEGGYVERPNFFSVSVWGAQGENASQYLRRGSRVAVDGRLEWSEWEDKDGHRREAVAVVAGSVLFLDRREASEGGEDLAGVCADGDEIAF